MGGITFGFIASGLLLGIAVGFILQRGRMCMNTAFRDAIFIKDLTLFRAYLIALIVMIIGANVLNDVGVIRLAVQPFYPIANIVGGYVFGLGMVLTGGCGSGVWYKVGEGQFNAVVAVTGFFVGIHTTATGILSPVYKLLKGVKVPVAGHKFPTVWQIFGDGFAIKWAVIAVIVIGIGIFILKGKPFSVGKQKGFTWPITGILLGIAGIFAFWASSVWEGFPRGMSFTTPTGEFFSTLLTGEAMPSDHPLVRVFPMYDLGPFKITWASVFIIAVPLGAYLSAKILKEFKWKIPPVDEMLTVLGGSLLMGFGATVGGGCNIGQGLTGSSTLSIGSVVALLFIIFGNWTMVYFKFIKPMSDMDV
jgi:uncharacterized membrane protein YedE/YeeE